MFRNLPEEDRVEFAREVMALAVDPRVEDLLTPAYLVVHVEHASKVLERYTTLKGAE